jgi:hypothetical protein
MAGSSKSRDSQTILGDEQEEDENVLFFDRFRELEISWKNQFDNLRNDIARRLNGNQDDNGRRRGLLPTPIESLTEPNNSVMQSRFPKEQRIDKLSASNFSTWAIDIEMSLKSMRLWNAIHGERANAGMSSEREFVQDELDEAYRVLYQSCDEERKRIIADTRSPRDAWLRLKKI